MKKYPWEGQGQKLTDYDIPFIGSMIGVGEDEIHALLDVESRGTGFTKQGVICLFESHVFYRQLPKEKKSRALNLGLAHTSWSKAKASGNYKNNYARLVQAYNFDQKAALESTSWGLGQIMGFNYKSAGYSSAEEMVLSFSESEANQLKGMIKFIIHNKLDGKLRKHDWTGFARGYNGSGFRANRYHIRLKERYEWWQKKPDTPWTPEMAEKEEEKAIKVIQEKEETKEKVKEVAPSIAIGTGAATGSVIWSGLPVWFQYSLILIILIVAGYIFYERIKK